MNLGYRINFCFRGVKQLKVKVESAVYDLLEKRAKEKRVTISDYVSSLVEATRRGDG